MHWHNTVYTLSHLPLDQTAISTVIPPSIYFSFENCECSNVTVTVSKASLCWCNFKNTSLNNRFCIKVCRRHQLWYHLTATESAMLYVAFFPCKRMSLLVHSQHENFKKKAPLSPVCSYKHCKESNYTVSKLILLDRCVERDWRIRPVCGWQIIRISCQWESSVRA
jgi:hypothetical protein